MKAAVVYKKGELPKYAEFPEPITANESEILISVKAVAITNLDKGIVSGQHYSSENDNQNGTVIGSDAIGLLENGTKVYARGISGTIAEKALVEKNRMVVLPEGIDDAVAAAIPNAVAGSAMALRFKAGIQPGETVLINGATGFTGQMAIQIAKHYGAKKIIVTGRNEKTLQNLLELGADEIISLKQDDESFISQLKEIHKNTPIDIVLDYLWGHSAELILSILKGNGNFTPKTRYVSVGSMSGDIIQLSASILRSVDLQLSGSGLGSWTKEEVKLLFSEILPEMFLLASQNKIKVNIEKVNLADIEKMWNAEVPDGKRLVVWI
ncbi:quinone oxidoreductase family protein [Flavobacterium johnsoniae]|uniref:Alcohol dehydrogenase, zinc-binding domain protein n=1 Tax=Flavobacterium johnsoniae (strain ATCC 17061 / DSM 2064 / JCM 8514 / BCRC 14874 / CCUG 350202 / NBRC 14942 / NCIMB 11054 / UW101) TaxID=376686 RepID=A5FFZ8_FLAJ1|nr:zinc-binding alcohol dehydrogenase family protein [Flavobacterium johnsoniae]ABQ05863.1 Alcohol dehydrogenase, zinc-binding domain protein [Flavobacterium johnsoniae UW101]OXG01102.1 alcohol dehydrogenase [Flavobacterium johnsoniae UW101]WQG81599.1 zinc-binding alcohol dehydrogenase family protein [Flavobacterium johnsoniae UW101]SHK58321.1 NADPH:quinone reductase [Flavobacterium johnsoniae]